LVFLLLEVEALTLTAVTVLQEVQAAVLQDAALVVL
jgi:hypothetical protein